MGLTVRDRIPVGTKFSAHPDRPWGPPSLLYNGYWVLPGGRGGRGVGLTPHSHLVLKVLEKSRAIALLTQRASVAYKNGANRRDGDASVTAETRICIVCVSSLFLVFFFVTECKIIILLGHHLGLILCLRTGLDVLSPVSSCNLLSLAQPWW